tara:strand:+ start:168 stop:404 length:237 start_codon:yes stop_codon:yes gene_type:complete
MTPSMYNQMMTNNLGSTSAIAQRAPTGLGGTRVLGMKVEYALAGGALLIPAAIYRLDNPIISSISVVAGAVVMAYGMK